MGNEKRQAPPWEKPMRANWKVQGLARILPLVRVAAVAAALSALPAVAWAVPNQVTVEGILNSSAGGPAPDGTYNLTFAIYKDLAGGVPIWTEAAAAVALKNGQFQWHLGSKVALTPKLLANLTTTYLGIKVESDAELPRLQVLSTAYAMRAAVAEGIDCSGCITAGQIDPTVLSVYAKSAGLAKVATSGLYSDLTGGPDLTGYAKTTALALVATSGKYGDLLNQPALKAVATTGSYTDLLNQPALKPVATTGLYASLTGAPVLKTVATSGLYSDLTGIPVLKAVATSGLYADLTGAPALKAVATTGAYADLTGKPTLAAINSQCGTNLFVKGINADGTLNCGPVTLTSSAVLAALPGDGLNEISNNLISNQFTDSVKGALAIAIPDNNPSGVADTITFPDIGFAQKLTVNLDVVNSDVSTLEILLTDPKGVVYYLCGPVTPAGPTWPAGLPTGTPCGSGASFAKSFGDPALGFVKPITGDLTTWVTKNPVGKWTLKVYDTKFFNNTFDGSIKSWSISLSTLSNKKIQVAGDAIVDGNASLTTATFSGPVVFNDAALFQNNWCPTQPNGERSIVANGVCTPGVGAMMNWANAVNHCAGKKAQLCSGAQTYMLRRAGLMGSNMGSTYQAWIGAYSDNDVGQMNEIVGNVADDPGATATNYAPCCYNATPNRSTDIIVKVAPADKGLRVTHIHDSQDAPFFAAAAHCTSLNSDICDKSQLVYLRTAGKITAAVYWGSSGQDSDGQKEYGAGPMSDDTVLWQGYGYACCASDRTALACPAGSTDKFGVCMAKVVNVGTTWVPAAKDCGAIGAHICSVAESSTLRLNGIITHTSNWSGEYNDCEGQCSGTKGLGAVQNDINPNLSYGYACCM